MQFMNVSQKPSTPYEIQNKSQSFRPKGPSVKISPINIDLLDLNPEKATQDEVLYQGSSVKISQINIDLLSLNDDSLSFNDESHHHQFHFGDYPEKATQDGVVDQDLSSDYETHLSPRKNSDALYSSPMSDIRLSPINDLQSMSDFPDSTPKFAPQYSHSVLRKSSVVSSVSSDYEQY
eukprot:1086754_1